MFADGLPLADRRTISSIPLLYQLTKIVKRVTEPVPVTLPLRSQCYKAKAEQRTIEVNHNLNEHKRKAREMLTSEEGLRHRSRRPIEPEAVFGQIKFDWHYRRFRHRGKDKVYMDFAILAMAHNLRKLMRKAKNELMERLFSHFLHLCKPNGAHKTLLELENGNYTIAA